MDEGQRRAPNQLPFSFPCLISPTVWVCGRTDAGCRELVYRVGQSTQENGHGKQAEAHDEADGAAGECGKD
eukprot:1465105-Rhodomonas_salina.2